VKLGQPVRYGRGDGTAFGGYLPPREVRRATSEDEAMGREIEALNEEMQAAGVRVFASGLQSESSARSLRLHPRGKAAFELLVI
jgi:hypothetical protein